MTKNFAHRGFCARYPENTMLAFQKAVDAGCDGIELDVHLTKDGELAIIHDEEVDRTTDGHGFVKDMTLAELRRLDAGGGQLIPAMEEYFDLVGNLPIITNIELKNSCFWYDGMEEKILKLIRARHLEERVILSSFNHYSIMKCKALAPEIRCGFLVYSWFMGVGAYTAGHGIECVHPDYNNLFLDEAFAEMRGHGVAINAYTINGREDMERLVGLGIDGIITNDPELLREVLEKS